MAAAPIGLSDEELTSLARVAGREADELGTELAARPWAIHDVLAEPSTVDAVLHPDSAFEATPPFVLFGVLTRLVADELLGSTYVYDWVGPRRRLPVFDVEPLQEFVVAPGRVLFIARLLASMVAPTGAKVPVITTDPWALLDWVDVVDPEARVELLRRLGDASLFLAGVHADALGREVVSVERAVKIARSLGRTTDDVLSMVDEGSSSPAVDTLEQLGACWYHEARRRKPEMAPVVADVAERIRAARRFLNHLSDTFLAPIDTGVLFANSL